MKRRAFIQGLLSLPFVGYVASKARDGVALFSRPHPIPHNTYFTEPDLNEKALEDFMIEMEDDRYKAMATLTVEKLKRSQQTSKLQIMADVFNNA